MNEHLRPASAIEDCPAAGDPGALEVLYENRGTVARPVRAGSAAEEALVEAYRDRGFLRSQLDPLELIPRPPVPELDPRRYGLDSDQIRSLVVRLEAAYCGPIGWEFGHIHDGARREWIASKAEDASARVIEEGTCRDLLALLTRAHTFEAVLAQRLPGARLFGLGGAESFIALLDSLLKTGVALGLREVVIGGMHRGRFNLLANICGKPLGPLLAEIQGRPAVPDGLDVSSDVSYHLGYSGEREFDGHPVRFSVSPHPSHLQLIPVITQGRARAKQADRGGIDGRKAVLPLLLHTDASFAGQGLVAEMFQLSKLAPYELGGTVHIVINNQLGFTTLPDEGRSARHPTDIAKLVEAPILHVNGDDPEAVHRVAQVAGLWRATFASDIVIDLICYRRPGHNEIDEPRFTQPRMYSRIDARPPVQDIYAQRLIQRGMEPSGIVAEARASMTDAITSGFAAARSYSVNAADWFDGAWAGFRSGTAADMLGAPETGVSLEQLRQLGLALTTAPAGFALDPKIDRFLDERRQSIETGEGLNWATGEALAFASLLREGTPVRFSGQDSVRGAFSQRHLELHDPATGQRHLVLAPVAKDGTVAEVHNTPLIEHAVLCFEYGLTLADPRRLVVWEAQFGEFLNVAQPVFDQCIACGEDRWLRSSGLVILLPHGLDGGGPDHSTGRPERLLAACADANMVVANVSTPANFFHLLRRHMRWPFRKPLVVLTPKALLRHKGCVSPLADFGPGTAFLPVIADGPAAARRVIACTGKVYYELERERFARGLQGQVALIRIEQLYPFPTERLARALSAHLAADIVWCEEEPENMGYFTHLRADLEKAAERPVRRVGRRSRATPAVGVKQWLEAEARALVAEALDLV